MLSMSKIAKDAFMNRNYHLAVDMFERCLREKYQEQQHHHNNNRYHQNNSSIIDLYFWYGDSLARCGRLHEAFDVYAHIANNLLNDFIPLDRLRHISACFIDSVSFISNNNCNSHSNSNNNINNNNNNNSNNKSENNCGFNSNVTTRNHHRHHQQRHSGQQQLVIDNFSYLLSNNTMAYADKFCKSSSNKCSNTNIAATVPSTEVIDAAASVVVAEHQFDSSEINEIQQHVDIIMEDAESLDYQHLLKEQHDYKENYEMQQNHQIREEFYLKNHQKSLEGQQQQHQQQQQQQQQQQTKRKRFHQYSAKCVTRSPADPLLCSICENILRSPVTSHCGHTFCKECYLNSEVTSCPLCNFNFSSDNVVNDCEAGNNRNAFITLKTDVLVKRLVEKWWMPELKARELNDEAAQYLDVNLLDEALKNCNESLEKCPNNFNGLLLRSEVLHRLNHYQSSLADADNALKSRPTSTKAHLRRALALASLGRIEEAFVSQCLAASLDTSRNLIATSTFRNEISKLLQHFLMMSSTSVFNSSPYGTHLLKRRKRRRLMKIARNLGTSDYDEANSSCGEDDHFIHNSGVYPRRTSNADYSQQQQSYFNNCTSSTTSNIAGVPRASFRIRTLLERVQQEIQKMKRLERKSSFVQVKPTVVDPSDFDCVLCCRTLWKPVVTPCGHTYCYVCLDRCMDYSSSCPLCMSPLTDEQCNYNISGNGSSTPVPFSLAKRSVTNFVEVAMQRFIPERYEIRQRQEIELEPSVPVFICTTAFPYVPCPLFVYEPRYRLMVRRAIESGERQFGIVQPHSGKTRYFDIGTMLDIRDCVLLSDGCSILSTIGCRRFKILTRDEKDGYETAKVEYIYDEAIPKDYIPVVSDMHLSVLSKAKRWFESLRKDIKDEILRSFGPMPTLEEDWVTIADGPAWAWWIIAILPLNQQLKVDILATTSLEKRLRAIEKTLDYISAKVRRLQQSCVVVQCEGLSECQAVDCCQRSVTNTTEIATAESSSPSNEHHTEYML